MNSKSISNYFLISLLITIVALSTAVVMGVSSSKNLNSENIKIYQDKIEKQTKELSECKKESDTLRQDLKTNENYISDLLKLVPNKMNQNNIVVGGKPIGNTEMLSKLLGMISRLQQNNETLFNPLGQSDMARILNTNREYLDSISLLIKENIADSKKGR